MFFYIFAAMLRRSWVEINLDTIARNYRICKSCLREGQEIMTVVKADAYGHGEAEVALRLQEEGCSNYAVSNIEEAKRLREVGIRGQVLILGYTPFENIPELLKYDITQALISEEYAAKMAGNGIKAQFAIETGMNRIGLDCEDVQACVRTIESYSSEFTLTGIFTHLCVADTPSEDEFTALQIDRFRQVAEGVEHLHLPYVHCLNSAGSLRSESFGNLARLGIILYGLKPDRANVLPKGIEPALSWKSVISMTRTVKAGETIGYGRTYTANRDMRIAVIPTGYADGYNRALSNRGSVLVDGVKVPVLGRVCMDQMMIDVTDMPEAKADDEVVLIGKGYDADDMAADAGTIGYEIICAISKRVPKSFIK